MLCQICNSAQSKYKCPKCEALYCSIPCYKSHKIAHVSDPHLDNKIPSQNDMNNSASDPPSSNSAQPLSLYDRILEDPQIKHYLTSPTLQKYLSLLVKYSRTLNNDMHYLLNLKVMDFREEGLEYSPVVEEFVQRFLYLEGRAESGEL